MQKKGISFSEKAQGDIKKMHEKILGMLDISKDAFENLKTDRLPQLLVLEEGVDAMKKELTASHFSRLAEGNCSMEVSPYYSSAIAGLERVGDHLINVAFSIKNPTGSQSQREDINETVKA